MSECVPFDVGAYMERSTSGTCFIWEFLRDNALS